MVFPDFRVSVADINAFQGWVVGPPGEYYTLGVYEVTVRGSDYHQAVFWRESEKDKSIHAVLSMWYLGRFSTNDDLNLEANFLKFMVWVTEKKDRMIAAFRFIGEGREESTRKSIIQIDERCNKFKVPTLSELRQYAIYAYMPKGVEETPPEDYTLEL